MGRISAVFAAYSLYYIVTVLICAYLIFDFKKKTKVERKKKGAGLLLSTMLIALSLGALTDTILPSLNVFILPPMGNIAALISEGKTIYTIRDNGAGFDM